MQILITGAQGQLGRDVATAAAKHGFDTLALSRKKLDITNTETVKHAIDTRTPELVVNCAAYTAVDRAEEEPQLAFAVNRDGPSNLAAACSLASIPLIHVSTDYVFDGRKQGDYTETDPVNPINVYGRSKAAGEEAVQKATDRFIILRTAWVFGAHGNNFVKTMLRLGQTHETIRVVNDQIGSPTFTGHLADAIMTIIDRYRRQPDFPWGIYHYGGQPPVSWHGFAEAIFATARHMGSTLRVRKLEAITTREYPTPARRAANSRLDSRKIEQTLGLRAASWQEGVQAVVKDWHNSQAIQSPE